MYPISILIPYEYLSVESGGVEGFSHPVYKQISQRNGEINRLDLSSLKQLARQENIESSGKRPLVQQRLKNYYKHKVCFPVCSSFPGRRQ